MGRIEEGWKLKWPGGEPGKVIAHVRFTHNRRRYDLTTGTRDPGEAAKAAARIYSDIVSGRVKRAASGALIHPNTELDVLAAKWLHATRNEMAQGAPAVYRSYIRSWVEVMPTIGSVTTAAIGAYQRGRLGSVIRDTVAKELSGLRRFLGWLVEQGMLRALPEFPVLAEKATGTRAKHGRKRPDYVLSPDEIEAILDEASDPFFVVCWETGLRPDSTISRLERRDLTAFGLVIRPEADKSRWGRTIPISDRARAALQAGLPFGFKRARLDAFKDAAELTLGHRNVTIYDCKHARCTVWVDEGKPLGGISFLTGVSIQTLVDTYVHSSRRAAEEILRGHTGAAAENVPKNTPGDAGRVSSRTQREKRAALVSRGATRENAPRNTGSPFGFGAEPQNDRSAQPLWFGALHHAGDERHGVTETGCLL